MKKNIKELREKEVKLIEELDVQTNIAEKIKRDLDSVTEEIINLKDLYDHETFKFINRNLELIKNTISPKHKLPEQRKMTVSAGEIDMVVSYPEKILCSDNDPSNIISCPRCTMLNFEKMLERILSAYYSK